MCVTDLQLSESDGQDRKSGGAVAASAVAGPASPSLVSSVTEAALQPQSTTPQPTQPSQPLQPGIETLNNKGTSPAPENNESAEFVPSCFCCVNLLLVVWAGCHTKQFCCFISIIWNRD